MSKGFLYVGVTLAASTEKFGHEKFGHSVLRSLALSTEFCVKYRK
jgi:hypothetical protein